MEVSEILPLILRSCHHEAKALITLLGLTLLDDFTTCLAAISAIKVLLTRAEGMSLVAISLTKSVTSMRQQGQPLHCPESGIGQLTSGTLSTCGHER